VTSSSLFRITSSVSETVVPMGYNGRKFEVWLRAELDVATGKVIARFVSVDPDTGLPPEVLTGFLPPEDGTGRGQGHISYLVRLKLAVPTGTKIRNVAWIQFDFGETIGTHQIDPHDPLKGTDPKKEFLNTVDSAPPSSRVLSLPAITRSSDFGVAWQGQDDRVAQVSAAMTFTFQTMVVIGGCGRTGSLRPPACLQVRLGAPTRFTASHGIMWAISRPRLQWRMCKRP